MDLLIPRSAQYQIMQTTLQLKVLRNHRLVKYRKEGNVVFYALDDNHVDTLVSQALSHIEHK